MACGPSNFQNGRRSDQLENGLRTGSENVFWNILISDSASWAETSFFRTNFSRRIPWCVWEPLKTLLFKKLMNSQNANGPQKNIACCYENDVRSDQLENGLRIDLKIHFWKILISYSRSRAETVFFHTNCSRRILWCAWEPVKTPCLLYTSPSPRDRTRSRMPSSA